MDYYLGQIGIYGFNFAPRGWALCAGSLMGITQNSALYSLIGTTYGGDGQVTFGLPDMRSRTAVDFGPQTQIGEMSGVENITLLMSDMASHNHLMAVNSSPGTAKAVANNVFAQGTDGTNALPAYLAPAGNVFLNPQTISMTGGNTGHPNIQPCLAANFCIATTGIYPARN
jgi:microcystin-dependent protein